MSLTEKTNCHAGEDRATTPPWPSPSPPKFSRSKPDTFLSLFPLSYLFPSTDQHSFLWPILPFPSQSLAPVYFYLYSSLQTLFLLFSFTYLWLDSDQPKRVFIHPRSWPLSSTKHSSLTSLPHPRLSFSSVNSATRTHLIARGSLSARLWTALPLPYSLLFFFFFRLFLAPVPPLPCPILSLSFIIPRLSLPTTPTLLPSLRQQLISASSIRLHRRFTNGGNSAVSEI